MTNARRPLKLLYDLSYALGGYSGIPQDVRLSFKTFATMPGIQLGGLLFPTSKSLLGLKIPQETAPYNQRVQTLSSYLANLVDRGEVHENLRLLQWPERLWRYRRLLGGSFSSSRVEKGHFEDVLWRLMFCQTLPPEDRALVTGQDFYVSDINLSNMIVSALYRTPTPRLDTRGWDVALFADARNVKLSPGTQKIVRIHDMIPTLKVDTVKNASFLGRLQMESIRACAEEGNTRFVCNTEPTREDVLSIFPDLEKRVLTIPYALPQQYKRYESNGTVQAVIRSHISTAAAGAGANKNQMLKNIFGEAGNEEAPLQYILSLATIEPRKNYTTLIQAWQRLKLKHNSRLKLIIVGSPGWKYESIVQAMQPHVLDGSLIHLEKVPPEELSALYSGAECFVFPSYYEGFGFPPLEAMQCECPTLVSDIPVHRWVMGDASIFCEPFSVEDVEAKIEQLTIAKSAKALRKDLAAKGLTQVSRYSVSVAQERWQELFESLA